MPEEDGCGCGDDCVVDDGCEAGGVLVSEGEHGLMVVGVSDIGVGLGVVNGWLRIAVSGAWRGWPLPPSFLSVCLGLFCGLFSCLAGFSGLFWCCFGTEWLLNGY